MVWLQKVIGQAECAAGIEALLTEMPEQPVVSFLRLLL
jgi:hypothetical protein